MIIDKFNAVTDDMRLRGGCVCARGYWYAVSMVGFHYTSRINEISFSVWARLEVYPLNQNKIKVLFICLGNICRSPTAQGVFLHKVAEAGLGDRIEVDSAGTAAYHINKAPDARAVAAAAARGVDLTPLRARKAIPEDFLEYDYILLMDKKNIADMKRITPAGYPGYFGLLMSFAGQPGVEVPDPYRGEESGFERVLDMVEKASDGLLKEIEARL